MAIADKASVGACPGAPKLALPPGPRMGRVSQGVLFHRDPLGFLTRVQARYGDVFTIRMALAGPFAVFADPRAVGQLVASDPSAARTGEARRRVLGIVPPRALLGADGDQHRAARDRVAAVFAPEALRPRREGMARIAEAQVARWPRGRPFRILPRMRMILDEIVVRLLLGVRDERRASALPLAIRRMLWTPGNPPLPPPGEGDGLLGDFGIRLFARRSQPVVRLLAEEIEARRARGDRDGDDVIGRMLRAEPPLTTDAMIDELLGLLMPSNESGPAGLTWVLDRLAREPEMAEHFVSAGDDDVRRDAFVQEALRLRPAVHSVLRRLIAPMEIVGHRLQPGAVAMVPIMLVHRDPRAFPNPDAFRPERFLSDPVPDAPYIPFGGGARRCLGEPLARTAIDVVLPVVLRRWRLTPVSREPERMVVRGTVAAPQRGALAIAHPAPAP